MSSPAAMREGRRRASRRSMQQAAPIKTNIPGKDGPQTILVVGGEEEAICQKPWILLTIIPRACAPRHDAAWPGLLSKEREDLSAAPRKQSPQKETAVCHWQNAWQRRDGSPPKCDCIPSRPADSLATVKWDVGLELVRGRWAGGGGRYGQEARGLVCPAKGHRGR